MPTLAYLLNDKHSKVFVSNQSLIRALGFRDALKVNNFIIVCQHMEFVAIVRNNEPAPLAAFESDK
jgi:hypothetical protein